MNHTFTKPDMMIVIQAALYKCTVLHPHVYDKMNSYDKQTWSKESQAKMFDLLFHGPFT